MTTTLTKDPRFGAITRVFGPSPLWAVCGALHKVLVATVSGGQVVFSGESADLGAEVLAVNTETSPNCHVLTANGLTFVTNTSTPQIVSQVLFNPGGGTWLHRFGGVFLATPLAKGGIQVVHGTTGAIIASHLSGMQSSQFAAADSSTDRLWVVDHLNASLSTFTVSSTTGAITFMGKIRAPNCRDVVKVVVDIDEESLFVVCRNRILRFEIPATSDTPVFAQDYGVAAVPYVDFVVLEADKYWISQATSLLPSPLDLYYGPMLGVWETSTEELIVAAPQSSIWTVNNVVPYYTSETIEETLPAVPPVTAPPPPVIAPLPPVITSSLTASVTEDTLFSYTITATGTGPIFYDVVSPPWWLTGIDHLTGAISGTPPTPGTENVTITATNAGGTDTGTLVVTVLAALGSFAQVTVNGAITGSVISDGVLYLTGSFTSVADSNGALSRTRAAAINISTGLWTSWGPVLVAGSDVLRCRFHSGMVYIYGSVTSVNGSGVNRVCRVHPTTGVLDSGWLPNFNNTVHDIALNGTTMLAQGAFTTVNGGARTGFTDVDLVSAVAGSLTIRNAAGTDSSTAVSDSAVRFSGASFFAACSNINTGVGQNQSDGYGFFSVSTGNAGQMSRAPAGSFPRAIETFGGTYLVAFPSSAQTWYILPAFSVVSFTTQGFACVNSLGVQTAVLPASAGAEGYDARFLSDGSFMFAGQTPSGIAGYAGCRGIFRTTSGGVLNTSFAPTWGVGAVRVNRLEPYLTAVFALGDWTATVNGVTRNNFAVFNPDTGALL